MCSAISSAIGAQTLGVILKISKFNSDALVQDDATLLWLENTYSLFPTIFMILSIIMIIKYPITKNIFYEILEEIERKKNGEELDLSLIKKII